MRVEWDSCESNGLCMVEAPEVFLLNEDDQLLLLQEQPADHLLPTVRRALRACPKQALLLEE